MSRTLLLPAALASLLLLAGCGEKQPETVNEGAVDAGLAEENVVTGDVTAIDAATADDARMANDLAPPAFGNDLEADNAATASNNAG